MGVSVGDRVTLSSKSSRKSVLLIVSTAASILVTVLKLQTESIIWHVISGRDRHVMVSGLVVKNDRLNSEV